VTAWDGFVQSVSAALQDRARPGGAFLWTDEIPERIAKVCDGEIVVAPAAWTESAESARRLIHHWIAAAFLPNMRLNNILEV
jgi:hypothetical protein